MSNNLIAALVIAIGIILLGLAAGLLFPQIGALIYDDSESAFLQSESETVALTANLDAEIVAQSGNDVTVELTDTQEHVVESVVVAVEESEEVTLSGETITVAYVEETDNGVARMQYEYPAMFGYTDTQTTLIEAAFFLLLVFTIGGIFVGVWGVYKYV